MNKQVKTVVFWLVILLAAFLLWQVVGANQQREGPPEISYSAFLAEIASGNVTRVTISRSHVVGIYRDNKPFRVTVPWGQEGMLRVLQERNVEIWFKDDVEANWPAWLMNLAPIVLLAVLWFFMIRQIRRTQTNRQT